MVERIPGLYEPASSTYNDDETKKTDLGKKKTDSG